MTRARKQASVNITERGNILLTTINRFGEYDMVELSPNEAEELLYDLHSLVMTLRGHAKPARKGILRRR